MNRTDFCFPWESMVRIRVFEERCDILSRQGKVRGSMHLCTGQEAVPVGACLALRSNDALSVTYRSHGWALARGIPPVEVFGECFGREVGCARGRGGSKHLGDWDRRLLPANAIVAGGIPLATGVAFAAKYRGDSDIALAVFGDGALNQGVFHEAMTYSVLWSLPVVFLCENNLYGELTPVGETNPVDEIYQRVAGYGMATSRCDGMDVQDVKSTVEAAIGIARAGGGPTFIEALTYRFCGHMTGDREAYRTRGEVEEWRAKDPLRIAEDALGRCWD